MAEQQAHAGKSYELPWVAMPKPRPRVTKHGTYNARPYTDWKNDIGEYLNIKYDEGVEGPVDMGLIFEPERTIVRVTPSQVKRFGRADIDNMSGGVMDAFQDAGFIDNDRNVVMLYARFRQ